MAGPPSLRNLRKRVTELEAEVVDLHDQVNHFRKSLQRMAGRRANTPQEPPQKAIGPPSDQQLLDIAMTELARGPPPEV